MTQKIIKQEQGRSMVEMLGTLAIIGVLSVGGIAGYTYAMDKHYANELLAGASERAVLVAAQIAAGREPNLNEFAHYSNVGGTFGQAEELEDGSGFIIPVSGVKGAVCENLVKAIDGTDITIANDDESLSEVSCDDENPNDIVFVYKTGLGGSETGMETSECDPACEEGEECIGGVCAEVSGQCSNNGDCDTWCATNGGGEKCYCAISATSTGNDSACYNNFSGTCAKATIKSGVSSYYIVSDNWDMTWWSAVNFCKAHNASLPSLADLGITGGYQDDALCQGNECIGTIDWLNLQKYLTGYFWVRDASICPMGEICTCNSDDPCIAGSNNNSCHVFNVLVEPRVVVGNYGRDENTITVCVDAF